MHKKYIFAKSFFKIWRLRNSLYSLITHEKIITVLDCLYAFWKNSVRLYPWTDPKSLVQHETSIHGIEPPQERVLNQFLFILMLLSLFKFFTLNWTLWDMQHEIKTYFGSTPWSSTPILKHLSSKTALVQWESLSKSWKNPRIFN